VFCSPVATLAHISGLPVAAVSRIPSPAPTVPRIQFYTKLHPEITTPSPNSPNTADAAIVQASKICTNPSKIFVLTVHFHVVALQIFDQLSKIYVFTEQICVLQFQISVVPLQLPVVPSGIHPLPNHPFNYPDCTPR
jgi:hypothetical protein